MPEINLVKCCFDVGMRTAVPAILEAVAPIAEVRPTIRERMFAGHPAAFNGYVHCRDPSVCHRSKSQVDK
jgi:hypothetical protein